MSKEMKARRPRARHRDVVLGALDERIQILADSLSDRDPGTLGTVIRIRELLDELRRSIYKDGGGEE
jgi:hypothetical protein